MKMERQYTKLRGYYKRISKRDVYSDKNNIKTKETSK